MCHTSTPLVIHGPRHQVRRCICGAIHVVWDNLNLSLSLDEWHDLNALCANFIHSLELGVWQIRCAENAVGLWYGPFGTTFTRHGWEGFSTLLAAANLITLPHAAEHDLYALN